MVETVQFNVGGKLFEVSRDLIDQNPDSMLAKLISETWEKEPDKPIFIDRDGEKFAHVLDYLRYGSIVLPPSIPQPMFDRELDYYGITAPEPSVSQSSLATYLQHLKSQMSHYTTKKDECEWRHDLLLLALECYYHYSQGKSSFSIESNNHLYKSYRCVNIEGLKVVNTFLEQYYGLKVKCDKCIYNGYKYTVSQNE